MSAMEARRRRRSVRSGGGRGRRRGREPDRRATGCGSKPDDAVGDELAIHPERVHRLPAHDGGEIYVVEAGSGPPIVLSHGVTLSVRTWAKQFEALPRARASA